MPAKPLPVKKLRRTTDPGRLKFKTTDELPLVDEIIGQPRAVRSIDFGIDIGGPGFNIFMLGPSGTGRMTTVQHFLTRRAVAEPAPDDWVYVHNFKDPLRPRAISLPAGQARRFERDMAALIKRLQLEIPPAFEAEAYQRAASRITRALDDEHAAIFERLDKQTRERGFTVARSDNGLFVVPADDKGQPLSAEALAALPPERQAELEQAQPDLDDALNASLREMRAAEQQAREQLRELDRRTAARLIKHDIDDLIARYQAECPEAAIYLEEVRGDIVEQVDEFKQHETARSDEAADGIDPLRRYAVNVLVENDPKAGAPVMIEMNPTFMNLIGRIERDLKLGETVLDFSMLRAGSLHRANGGYLIIRAGDILRDEHTWEALKRALNTRQIMIEDPGTQLQMFSTRTLESEPIPLKVKVVLLGSPALYYELFDGDEDFRELFKVKADFAVEMPRSRANERAYSLFVRARCAEHHLPPFDRGAVAEVIDYGSRLAEDQFKLSTRFGAVSDLIVEAAHWAGSNGRDKVTAQDVRQALREQRYRSNLVEQETYAMFSERLINVQTQGSVVGQVNGLSVIEIGDYQFGQPTRISARTYVGRSGVVAIEREVHLSGPIHNKGVLILDGYLGGQYAIEKSLSLTASISFEQSYSEIEGDSASSTELYALLSALADLPVKQNIAVTGSVDQQGHVQPIGGAQYKIEGFFDVCQARGLTGDQGVMIPIGNVRSLMLRNDVVEACRQGKFHIWAVKTIDEGLELLTGVKAGQRGRSGHFTRDSVHARVEARLRQIAESLEEEDKEEDKDAKAKRKKINTTARDRRRKK
jgi:predicted ATP-dependent protease